MALSFTLIFTQYLANMASKSANYCAFDVSDGYGLLLLCEVQLGNPLYRSKAADSNAARNSVEAVCLLLVEY